MVSNGYCVGLCLFHTKIVLGILSYALSLISILPGISVCDVHEGELPKDTTSNTNTIQNVYFIGCRPVQNYTKYKYSLSNTRLCLFSALKCLIKYIHKLMIKLSSTLLNNNRNVFIFGGLSNRDRKS